MQAILNTCLSFTSNDLNVTEAGGGAVITSGLLVGAAVGGFFAGQAADAVGPRRTLLCNNLPLLAGSCLSAVAPRGTLGFWSMLLGWFLRLSFLDLTDRPHASCEQLKCRKACCHLRHVYCVITVTSSLQGLSNSPEFLPVLPAL